MVLMDNLTMDTTQAHLDDLADVKLGIRKRAGSITRQFTVTCAVCGQDQTVTANNVEVAIETFQLDFRITAANGWTHHRCCKLMPTTIKLNKIRV